MCAHARVFVRAGVTGFALLLVTACSSLPPRVACDDFPAFVPNTSFSVEKTKGVVRSLLERTRNGIVRERGTSINGYAAIGDFDAAFRMAEERKPSNLKDLLYRSIAEAAAERGNPVVARKAAEEVKGESERRSALLALAWAEAAGGDLERARAALSQASQAAEFSKEYGTRLVLQAVAQGGHVAKAWRLYQDLKPGGYRSRVMSLMDIAEAEFAAGRTQKAATSLRQAAREASKAPLDYRLKPLELTRQIALRLSEYAFVSEAGDILIAAQEDVLAALSDRSKVKGLLQIAYVQEAIGAYEAATETSDLMLRALFEKSVHLTHHGLGDRRIVKFLIGLVYRRQGLAAAESVQSYFADEVLRDTGNIALVREEALSGETDDALRRANTIQDAGARCAALASAAVALADRGKLDLAMAALGQLDNDSCFTFAGWPVPAPKSMTFNRKDPYAQIALRAAYYGDRMIACRALNAVTTRGRWIEAIAEMAAVRTARGDLHGAMHLLDLKGGFDSEAWQASVFLSTITNRPAPWNPSQPSLSIIYLF